MNEKADSISSADLASLPILRTKLHPPPITPELLPRERLLAQIGGGRNRPLTLISAPAGYGKSIVAGHWLAVCEAPCAWLSLDEHDNNLVGFLNYLVTAIRQIFPAVELQTEALLHAPITPSPLVLARCLANDLAQLATCFVLVLDDYHQIHEMAIHDLLTELLRHPPDTMHLVIIARGDPPLALDRLRALRQMNEIRLHDLSFTPAETASYLNEIMGIPVDRVEASSVQERTEGWATALHLVALSLRHRHDVNELLSLLQTNNGYVHDYLAAEVVAQQPPAIQAWMQQTSILNRLCAPVCDALCQAEATAHGATLTGREFLAWLERAQLFCIPLDSQGHWFRYHHLYQQFLRQRLAQRMGEDAVRQLHIQASAWFADNGLIDEARHHALAGDDLPGAADLVERHWHAEAQAARWYVVEGWLNSLSPEIKQQRPALLLAEAYGAMARFQMGRVPGLLEQAEPLLDDRTATPQLLGELNFLRGTLLYWQGQAQAGVERLEAALAQTEEKHVHIVANIELSLALARYAVGQKRLAIHTISARIQATDPSQAFLLGQLSAGLAFIHLLAADLSQAGRQAARMHVVNRASGNGTIDAWSSYLRACTCLHAYDLGQACDHFAVVAQQRYTLDAPAVIDALAGLALTQQLLGRQTEADEALEQLMAFAQEKMLPQYVAVAESCKARLSLLRGDLTSTAIWAQAPSAAPSAPGLFFWLEVPWLTRARVLIAVGSRESLEQAVTILQTLGEQSEAVRLRGQTIEIAVLQSLALEGQGYRDRVLAALAEAVSLAETGGWIRPFVESGRPMAALLTRLKQGVNAHGLSGYIDQLLAAFPATEESASMPSQSGPVGSTSPGIVQERLTPRERQTLGLLTNDLSTEEIAAEMVVSVGTVRTYAKRIYGKLGAHSRFEAVVMARDMGLL